MNEELTVKEVTLAIEGMSNDESRKSIEAAGFAVKPAEPKTRSRNPLRRYIQRLAESSKKNFGDGPLDCCN